MVILGLMFAAAPGPGAELVKLPPPSYKGAMSVEEALKARRTVREFAARGLDLQQVSQLLWGADGLSDPRGHRTAASAGATYPLEIYLVVGERGVADLPAGVYRYLVKEHALEPGVKGDLRQAVARASLHQTWMTHAPVMVVIAAEYRRCTARYGERGLMYTHMEAGPRGHQRLSPGRGLGVGGRHRRGLRGPGLEPDAATAQGVGAPAGDAGGV